jgi:hypothetical protein
LTARHEKEQAELNFAKKHNEEMKKQAELKARAEAASAAELQEILKSQYVTAAIMDDLKAALMAWKHKDKEIK